MSTPIAPTIPPQIWAAVQAWEARRAAELAEAPVRPPVTPSPRGKHRDPGNGGDIINGLRGFFAAGGSGTARRLAKVLRKRRGAVEAILCELVNAGLIEVAKENGQPGRPSLIYRGTKALLSVPDLRACSNSVPDQKSNFGPLGRQEG